MTFNATRARELLRLGSGRVDATFREGQEAAIRHIVEGRGRLLVVQKTGWVVQDGLLLARGSGRGACYATVAKRASNAPNGTYLQIVCDSELDARLAC